MNTDIKEKLTSVELIVSDIDGVLTDGLIRLTNSGDEIKAFSAKDAPAISFAQSSGIRVAFITGRLGEAVRRRAEQFGVELMSKKEFEEDKESFAKYLKEKYNVSPEQVLYVGDDLGDLHFMRQVGVTVCPQNAASDVLKKATFCTDVEGGRGVLAEAIQKVMEAKGLWNTENI